MSLERPQSVRATDPLALRPSRLRRTTPSRPPAAASPIRCLVDVRDGHQTPRNVGPRRVDHRALDERIRPTELTNERRDGDFLIASGRSQKVDLHAPHPDHEGQRPQRPEIPTNGLSQGLHPMVDAVRRVRARVHVIVRIQLGESDPVRARVRDRCRCHIAPFRAKPAVLGRARIGLNTRCRDHPVHQGAAERPPSQFFLTRRAPQRHSRAGHGRAATGSTVTRRPPRIPDRPGSPGPPPRTGACPDRGPRVPA